MKSERRRATAASLEFRERLAGECAHREDERVVRYAERVLEGLLHELLEVLQLHLRDGAVGEAAVRVAAVRRGGLAVRVPRHEVHLHERGQRSEGRRRDAKVVGVLEQRVADDARSAADDPCPERR